jgi:hypothetical protein
MKSMKKQRRKRGRNEKYSQKRGINVERKEVIIEGKRKKEIRKNKKRKNKVKM